MSSHTMCLLTTSLVSWNSLSKSGNIAYEHTRTDGEKQTSAQPEYGNEKTQTSVMEEATQDCRYWTRTFAELPKACALNTQHPSGLCHRLSHYRDGHTGWQKDMDQKKESACLCEKQGIHVRRQGRPPPCCHFIAFIQLN